MVVNKIVPFILALSIILIGCGDNKMDGNTTDETELAVEAPENEITAEEEVDATREVGENAIADEDWQINNYAVFLNNGDRIAANSDVYDYNSGDVWYYETLDVKGGFARVTGAIEGAKEYVVWRMADGNDLVGEMEMGCGPACEYDFTFYTGRGSQIAKTDLDVIFPMEEIEAHRKAQLPRIIAEYPVDYPEDSQLIYNFPQKGTGMQVDLVVGADEITVPLLKLGWNKSSFYVEEKFQEINLVEG